MGVIYDPIRGGLVRSAPGSGGSPSPGGNYSVEKITLNSTNITDKYIVLSATPSTASLTRVIVIEGIEQDYGVDFEVTSDDAGRRLSWDGLGLESLLADGDKLVIVYT